VTGSGFVQALVFGLLANPASTRNELQQAAVTAGMSVTTPALDQRFTPKAVLLLEGLLEQALTALVEAQPTAHGLLSRFRAVVVADSTSIALPDALASVWSGPNGVNDAAVKVAVRWDLQAGGLNLWLSEARLHDQQTAVCASGLAPGSLRLNDLGFFNLETFAADVADGVDFFSRYKVGTHLYSVTGEALDLVALLGRCKAPTVDQSVALGQRRLPVRLLAVRVSPAVAAERRRRLRYRAKRKYQPVSQTALALADWTVYITSVPVERLTVDEAPILGMTRWQIERLFALWKGSGLLDEWRSNDPWRVWVEFYGKLLALVVQHWLLLTGCWQHLDRSLHRAAQVIRKHAFHLLSHLHDAVGLRDALTRLADVLATTCRMSKRKTHPLTFQYWLETVHV
jgi:hypothetical protein